MLLPSARALLQHRQRWLVTGAAGFIGSNLVETLLSAGQHVTGLDNFSTGHQRNLEEVRVNMPEVFSSSFRFVEGDIRDRAACADAVTGVDCVLHQAALGSVPRSLKEPLVTHDVNVTGFLNMLDAARLGGRPRFVYAASSSTYGDEPTLPKCEDRIGAPLSPYAATKLTNEIYAGAYAKAYDYKATGLRYFNVFGPRQDPNGAYAAVIPKWASAMIAHEQITINGDGQTSRDFCYIANAVQANILAALGPDVSRGEVFNVAVGQRTSLLELFDALKAGLQQHQIQYDLEPQMSEFRAGDVRHSLADISKARHELGFNPSHDVIQGLTEALPWYVDFFKSHHS
jgi:UDP-N-acetylglucosamine 4-epimerase